MGSTHRSRYSSHRPNSIENNRDRDNFQKSQKNGSKTDSKMRGPKRYQIIRSRIFSGFFVLVFLYVYLFKLPIDVEKERWSLFVHGGLRSAQYQLTELRPIDYEQYTIRINTWRRPAQLVQSVKHHASCPGVKEIQIVWCDKENQPPQELMEFIENRESHTKVVIEHHAENSLNERFNILEPTPTLGILSIDDDVLRPCEAIDSGFFQWLKSPHRMVGFDARTHVENEDGSWQYGYLSTTKRENKYSLSLTRYCFIHRDYMNLYIKALPQTMLDTIAKNFNCEDIAMSLMISSLTDGQPPLLADFWAMNSQLKLEVESGISGSGTHKKLRDNCLDTFASIFGMKDENSGNRLHKADWVLQSTGGFSCGAKVDDKNNIAYTQSSREVKLEQTWEQLRRPGNKEYLQKYIVNLMYETGEEARAKGLLATKK